jgi:hypothetical protein
MINPAFTPVALVEEARLVVAGALEGDEQGDRWTLAEAQVLKGEESGAPQLLLALLNARDTDNARAFLRSSAGSEAILFQGPDARFLLVKDVWLGLKLADGAGWQVSEFNDQYMLKTYAGGADKLIEMARYILHDEDADVPVAVGVAWRAAVRIGHLPQPVAGMAPLASGSGRGAQLFVASSGGDRLFAYDRQAGRFDDLTGRTGLDTASRAFAFVDLDRDGRADLVSWDGECLSVRLRRQDGGFAPLQGAPEPEWRGGCNGLTPFSLMQDGFPGVLVSSAWPHLLSWDGERWSVAPLPGDQASCGPAGSAPVAVAADWDGDGHADVLQLREAGGLLWTGKGGGFAQPQPCGVTSAGSPARWAVGDFDTDGRLDLAVNGPETCELWENAGGGRFRPVIRYAGSLLFRQEPGAADCLATDLNHDGRPDLALLYEKGPFFYHFNRGFRCMAEEGQLTLDGGAAASAGPTRAAAGDFDGDGSLDLAVAFTAGEVSCFFNGLPEAPGLWVSLPRGHTGPVTLSAWQGEPYAFCVGTQVVAGHEPTYFSLRKHGPCTLKWRWPGGPLQELVAKDGAELVLPRTAGPSVTDRGREGAHVGEERSGDGLAR